LNLNSFLGVHILKKINNWLHKEFEKLHIGFGIKQTGLFLISCILSYFVTGNPTVSLTGALASLLYFLMPNKDIKLKSAFKLPVLYLGVLTVAFFGSLATTNTVTSLALNMIVPFIIVCMLNDESNVLGYAYHYIIFTYVQFTEITLKIFPLYVIAAFIGMLVAYVFHDFVWSSDERDVQLEAVDDKKVIVESIKTASVKVKESLEFDSLTSRFAVILSVATAVSITLWSYVDLPKWYWIAKATCFTLVPIWSQIKYRAADRLKSTAVGCAIFSACSLLAPHKYVLILATLLALVLAISYIPKKQMSEFYVFSAFVSLSLASFPPITVSMYKATYVLIGVLLAAIMNWLLLPNVANKVCRNDTVKNETTTVC